MAKAGMNDANSATKMQDVALYTDPERNNLLGRGNDAHTAVELRTSSGTEAKTKYTWVTRLGKWISVRLAPEALCSDTNIVLRLFSILILLLLLWGTAYTLLKEHVAPTSNIFMLFSLIILAYIAGQLIAFIKLPPLLGMLLVGILMRNVKIFDMKGVYERVVSVLRNVALVVILIKAGLGLDAAALKRLSLVVARLAFVPCLVEAATVACVSHFFLDLPWLWGALLGFVLGAVSPAVVVPSLLALKDQGYGEDKGISTLVIAASSIDDILAISGFGVVLSTLFSEGELVQQILQGPLEVVIGLSFGIAWGILAVYIPHRKEAWMVAGRVFMVFGGGLFAVFGSQLIDFPGAGPLATISMAFVACFGWKKQGWSSSNPVEKFISGSWQLFQPVLFGLIGTAVDLSTLEGDAVTYGIATLSISLSIRLLTTFLVLCGGTLNLKERLFVAISWFPKATVQAAIGPVALDLATKKEADDTIMHYATQIVTIAVLSIIITAPLGAIAIYIAGPRLLTKAEPQQNETANNNNPQQNERENVEDGV